MITNFSFGALIKIFETRRNAFNDRRFSRF